MRPANIVHLARRKRGTVALLVIVAAVATVVATSEASSDALPPPQVLDYQVYVNGKGKANPKLSPIVIGWFNGQGEEEGVRCGQQMVNDPAVKVILTGGVFVGNQSIYATVKGAKAYIGVVGSPPIDTSAKKAFFLNGSQTSVLGPFGTFTKRFLPNVKTVTIVYPNQPGADTAAFALRKAMQQAGLSVSMIATPQLATDLLGPATQASQSDMIIPALGFTECVPFARALDQINYTKPVLSTPLCTFIPRSAYAGGDLPKWTY